jgi:hypothetical protein
MTDRPIHHLHPSKTITIVEEHGSFLLVRGTSGFAVMERRNGRIYPMAPGEREGIDITAEAAAALLAAEGCLSESEARRLFRELSERGDRLAQTLR